MGMRPLVRNQANKHPCTQTIELWARRSCSPLDFGNKPINKHLASDLEDQTKWLALIDKNVLSASLQLGWRVRLALVRRSYPGHGVSSKQETSGSSCTSRLIIFEEHPSDTQRVPTGFLLELVHSSTPPLVSGTVRSRPLAAKVNWRLLPLFRRPATAPRRFYAPGLGCSRGARRGARRGGRHYT